MIVRARVTTRPRCFRFTKKSSFERALGDFTADYFFLFSAIFLFNYVLQHKMSNGTDGDVDGDVGDDVVLI